MLQALRLLASLSSLIYTNSPCVYTAPHFLMMEVAQDTWFLQSGHQKFATFQPPCTQPYPALGRSTFSLPPERPWHTAEAIGSMSSSTELPVLYPVCPSCVGGSSCSMSTWSHRYCVLQTGGAVSCGSFLVLPPHR